MADKRARALKENAGSKTCTITQPILEGRKALSSNSNIQRPGGGTAAPRKESSPDVAPCEECGQVPESRQPEKGVADLARFLTYERGSARGCPCCRKNGGVNKASIGDEVKKRAPLGPGRSAGKLLSTLALEEEHVLRTRLERALCQGARLQRACAGIAGRVGEARSKTCKAGALWRWRWIVQVNRTTTASGQHDVLASQVAMLHGEVAGWAAKLGGRRELWRAWLAWRSAFKQDARERRRALVQVMAMAQRRRRACLRAALREWAQKAAAERQQAALLHKAVGRMKSIHVAAGFARWREAARGSKRRRGVLYRAVQKMNQRCLSLAFAEWRLHAEARKRAQSVLQHVARRWQHRQLAATWDTWREQAKERKGLRSKLEKIGLKMQFSRQSAAFSSWLEFVFARRAAKEVMARVVARFQNRQLSAAFASWQEWVAQRKQARVLALQVIGRLSHQTLTRAFVAWRVALDPSASNSAEAPRVSEDEGSVVQCTNCSQDAKASIFSAWQELARKSARARAVALRVVQRSRHRSLAAAFQAFVECARVRKARRVALVAICSRKWASASCLALALERWRTTTLWGHRRRLRARVEAAERTAQEATKQQQRAAQQHAAALAGHVPMPQVIALSGVLEGRLRAHAAASQSATQLNVRFAALLWRQRCLSRCFHRWSNARLAAQQQRSLGALQHAETALRSMVRELSAESAQRRVLEASMASLVTERACDASSTRAMMEAVEEQVRVLRALIRVPSEGNAAPEERH